MKFSELQMDEWDGNYEIVFQNAEVKILLLNLIVNIEDFKEEGRHNLLAVDKNNNILWFAEPAYTGRNFSWFVDAKIQNNKLIAWYSGNVLVEIDMSTGKLLKEEFIR